MTTVLDSIVGSLGLKRLGARLRVQRSPLISDAAAVAAHARAADLEQVVRFGHALAGAIDETAIRDAVSRWLPQMAPARRVWVLTCRGDHWEPLLHQGDVPLDLCRRAATDAIARVPPDPASADHLCLPLVAGGCTRGVLGVEGVPSLTDHERNIFEMVVALLAAALGNAALIRDLHDSSVRDPLTGCFTRPHTFEFFATELRRARRSRAPLSVVMFDLDHFKAINDTHGHLGGDAVLAAIGGCMQAVLRGGDVKCRYGGEEFLLVLPDTPLAGAHHVAETLRRRIAGSPVPWTGRDITVTASFGATTIAQGELDPFAVIARADAALYRAKRAGRNRVDLLDPGAEPGVVAGGLAAGAPTAG